MHWLLRLGLNDTPLYADLKMLGLAFFVLFGPVTIGYAFHVFKTNTHRVFANHGTLSIVCLLLPVLAGWLVPSLLEAVASLLFIGLGYVCFLICLVPFIRQMPGRYTATGLLLVLFFSIWVVSKTLFPIPLEIAATGVGPVNIDFWYHSALTQMLKTYGVPSTGFDGLPWMYYHYGTHWMVAQLSKLLDLPLLQLYAAGYAIVFAPLFFQAYLVFALTVRKLAFGRQESSQLPGFLFWTVLLCVFIQVIKHQYSGGLLGSFLASPSYVIAISVMFFFFVVCLHCWPQIRHWPRHYQFFFIWIVLPLFATAFGYLKISVLYNVLCLLGYLFLRLALFRKWQYWVSLCLIGAAFWWVYPQVVETLTFGNRQVTWDGKWEPLFFYKNTHRFRPVVFFVFYFQWVYLFVFINLVKAGAGSWRGLKQAVHTKQTLGAECALVLSFTGLFPSFFLLLTGDNALYFSATQLFFGSALLLAYLPALKNVSFTFPKISPAVRHSGYWVLGIGVFLVLYMHTRNTLNELLGYNAAVRKTLVGDTSTHTLNLSSAVTVATAWGGQNTPEIQAIRRWFSPAVQDALDKDSVYVFLRKVAALDNKPLNEKKAASLYINLVAYKVPFRIPCFVVPFLLPGLSGMASLYGQPYDCGMGGYGFEYYTFRHKNHPGWDRILTRPEICAMSKAKQLNQVVVFNLQKESFETVTCLQQ